MTHTSTEQPEALLVAKWLRESPAEAVSWADVAADHLERLHARVQSLEEEASMYRWLRDHYHGFEPYRTEWARSQGLFERDIKKQMGITQEKQG